MRATFGVICLATTLTYGEVEKNVPLGIEAVTGIRSDYIHRGFRLSSTALEFQLEAEIALNRDTFFNFGAWYLAGGSDDFRESGAFLDFSKKVSEDWTLGTALTYRDYQNSPLRSGLELGLSALYQVNDDWDFKSAVFYDFESTGWYGETSVAWSYPVTKDSFIDWVTGVSFTSDYFERSGANDLFSRMTYTFALTNAVGFSPYLGLSIPLKSEVGEEEFFAGLNFEVLF